MAADTAESRGSQLPRPALVATAVVTVVLACVLSSVVLSSARVATGANRINPVTESWFLRGWASNLVVRPGQPIQFVIRTNVAHQIAWRAVDVAMTPGATRVTPVASGVRSVRADNSQVITLGPVVTRSLRPGTWLAVSVAGTNRPPVVRVPA